MAEMASQRTEEQQPCPERNRYAWCQPRALAYRLDAQQLYEGVAARAGPGETLRSAQERKVVLMKVTAGEKVNRKRRRTVVPNPAYRV